MIIDKSVIIILTTGMKQFYYRTGHDFKRLLPINFISILDIIMVKNNGI